jgi:hypothetical protein
MNQSDSENQVFDGLPVPGYQPQKLLAVGLVSTHKHFEERLLRHLDILSKRDDVDQRWLAIGRTHAELAFMAINRSVFRPTRIPLPEDPKSPDDDVAKSLRAGSTPPKAA